MDDKLDIRASGFESVNDIKMALNNTSVLGRGEKIAANVCITNVKEYYKSNFDLELSSNEVIQVLEAKEKREKEFKRLGINSKEKAEAYDYKQIQEMKREYRDVKNSPSVLQRSNVAQVQEKFLVYLRSLMPLYKDKEGKGFKNEKSLAAFIEDHHKEMESLER